MKYLRIHNIGIHIIVYQNRFINESVRKNFLKFLERQTERRSFFARCRKTHFLNKKSSRLKVESMDVQGCAEEKMCFQL